MDDKIEEKRAKNRDEDRMLAIAGKLYDADPLFASKKHLEYAGMFIRKFEYSFMNLTSFEGKIFFCKKCGVEYLFFILQELYLNFVG